MSSLVENRESYGRSNTFSGMANIEWSFRPDQSLNFNLYAYKEKGRSDVSDNSLYSFSPDATVSTNKGKTDDDLLSGTLEYNAKFKDDLNLKVSYGLIYGGTDSDNWFLDLPWLWQKGLVQTSLMMVQSSFLLTVARKAS